MQLKTRIIFFDSGPPKGDFCEKGDFFPLKVENTTFSKKSEKELGWARMSGEGGQQYEKIFWTN